MRSLATTYRFANAEFAGVLTRPNWSFSSSKLQFSFAQIGVWIKANWRLSMVIFENLTDLKSH